MNDQSQHDEEGPENWRAIFWAVGKYMISDKGRVMNLSQKGFILRERLDKDGYNTVILQSRGKKENHKVHRLVAQAFIPNPDNLDTVNHIDHDRLNNTKQNLEWMSHSDNAAEAQAKTYNLLLDNEPIVVYNMKKYCKDNGYDKNTMSRLVTGKITEYKGHTLPKEKA